MTANTKDCRCRQLLNHLQKPHLLRNTFITDIYITQFHKTQSNGQNRNQRLSKSFYVTKRHQPFFDPLLVHI